MNPQEQRRQALRAFVLANGGHAAVTKKYELKPSHATYLSQLTTPESTASFGERSAANWEARLKLPPGTLSGVSKGIFEGTPVEAHADGELLPNTAHGLKIPLLANAGAMGPGEEALHDDVIVGTLTVSPNWVSSRVRPSSDRALRFIHAYGDSMAPTFGDGDVLLVDTGARDPSHIDGVYVLTVHERLFIKRVRQRLDGAIEVSSDNPTVKTIDVLNGDHQIQVLGRVVWAWNGKKL